MWNGLLRDSISTLSEKTSVHLYLNSRKAGFLFPQIVGSDEGAIRNNKEPEPATASQEETGGKYSRTGLPDLEAPDLMGIAA